MSRLTRLQREMIAHAHATGATIADLAQRYGKTPAAMGNILRQPSMRAIVEDFRKETSDHVERAKAFLQFKAMDYAQELDKLATCGEPKIQAWALPLALKSVIGGPTRTVQYEGVERHTHTHDVQVTHSTAPAPPPQQAQAVLDALLQAAQAMRARGAAADITQSRHILSGPEARPRPEGQAALAALTEGPQPVPAHVVELTQGLVRQASPTESREYPERIVRYAPVDDDYVDRSY